MGDQCNTASWHAGTANRGIQTKNQGEGSRQGGRATKEEPGQDIRADISATEKRLGRASM